MRESKDLGAESGYLPRFCFTLPVDFRHSACCLMRRTGVLVTLYCAEEISDFGYIQSFQIIHQGTFDMKFDTENVGGYLRVYLGDYDFLSENYTYLDESAESGGEL